MIDTQLKIAKLQAKTAKENRVMELLRNPVVEIILAYLIIETLQKIPIGEVDKTVRVFGFPIRSTTEKQFLISDKAGTVAEGAILAAVALQQLAPLYPYAAQNASQVVSTVGELAKFAPLLIK